MNVKPLLIAGGAYYLYTLIAKGGAAASLNYRVVKVSISFDGLTPILQLTIGVQNPTNQSFTIRSIVGDITSNDNYLANVSSFTASYIVPNAESLLQINARVSVLGLASDVYDTITGNSDIRQNIKFAGSVNVDGVVIPLKLNYAIG